MYTKEMQMVEANHLGQGKLQYKTILELPSEKVLIPTATDSALSSRLCQEEHLV